MTLNRIETVKAKLKINYKFECILLKNVFNLQNKTLKTVKINWIIFQHD